MKVRSSCNGKNGDSLDHACLHPPWSQTDFIDYIDFKNYNFNDLNHIIRNLTSRLTVLATFVESLVQFHNETYKSSLKLQDFHSYHFCDVWGGTNDEGM